MIPIVDLDRDYLSPSEGRKVIALFQNGFSCRDIASICPLDVEKRDIMNYLKGKGIDLQAPRKRRKESASEAVFRWYVPEKEFFEFYPFEVKE